MCLTNEAAQHFLIFTFKHFNGHLAVKVWVVPLVDISHSASTHQPAQLIATECFPLQSCHRLSPSTSAKKLSGRNKLEPLQSFFGYIVYKTVQMFFCYVNQSSCAISGLLQHWPLWCNLNASTLIECAGMMTRLLHYFLFVHCQQLSLLYHGLSINHDHINFATCRGVNQGRDRVHRGCGVQAVEINYDQVGLLAHLQ